MRVRHDHQDGAENLVALDQGAGLVAVEAWHHDIHADDVRLVIGDLGQGIEPVDCREDLAAFLGQEVLSRASGWSCCHRWPAPSNRRASTARLAQQLPLAFLFPRPGSDVESNFRPGADFGQNSPRQVTGGF